MLIAPSEIESNRQRFGYQVGRRSLSKVTSTIDSWEMAHEEQEEIVLFSGVCSKLLPGQELPSDNLQLQPYANWMAFRTLRNRIEQVILRGY